MIDEATKKRYISLFKFFFPIILGFSVYITVGFLMSESMRIKYFPLITAYFFPPFGKESVIPSGIIAGFHPLVIALSIAFVDIIIALFLLWNYDYAKKIPLVGKFMEKVENIGKSSSNKYGWIKPLRFIGIILFVIVPFQGSGGLVGSIVGRLVGMKPINTFYAISIGAISGTILIAYFADAILSVFIKNLLYGLLLVIIILVIAFMIYIFKRNKDTGKNNKKSK
jgi:uncharacterized membrane protein